MSKWKDLYKAAAVAAVISELILIFSLVLYFFFPYAPGNQTTETIFLNLQSNLLGALISLDLFLLIGNLVGIVLFLTLFVSLKPVNESMALIALAVGLVGVVLLIPARPLVELHVLSGEFAAATTDVAKSQLLAQGDVLLRLFDGTGWFLNNLLGGFSLLLSSVLMLRSELFTKATAWVGIVTNAMVTLFFIPVVGMIFLFLTIPGYMIWYFQLGRKFFALGWAE